MRKEGRGRGNKIQGRKSKTVKGAGCPAPFSVKIMRKEGEKEERRSREEKGVRLFPH
jgi:hypothetical protein